MVSAATPQRMAQSSYVNHITTILMRCTHDHNAHALHRHDCVSRRKGLLPLIRHTALVQGDVLDVSEEEILAAITSDPRAVSVFQYLQAKASKILQPTQRKRGRTRAAQRLEQPEQPKRRAGASVRRSPRQPRGGGAAIAAGAAGATSGGESVPRAPSPTAQRSSRSCLSCRSDEGPRARAARPASHGAVDGPAQPEHLERRAAARARCAPASPSEQRSSERELLRTPSEQLAHRGVAPLSCTRSEACPDERPLPFLCKYETFLGLWYAEAPLLRGACPGELGSCWCFFLGGAMCVHCASSAFVFNKQHRQRSPSCC